MRAHGVPLARGDARGWGVRLAARAREHVAEHFTVEGMCDATLRVYGALLVQAEEKAAGAAG